MTSISAAELKRRENLVKDLANRFGFRGQVEYFHVLSQSGGAQFGLGRTIDDDVLAVYAEAFVRDANPNDFSLAAIVAHECGHQVAVRNSTLNRWLHSGLTLASEEVLASIIGSLLVFEVGDHNDLAMKAIHDVIRCGVKREKAKEVVMNLRSVLETIL